MTTTATRTARPSPHAWLVSAGLVLLSATPVAAGMARVTELASGAEVTPDNARFFDQPVPVVLHILGAATYLMVGAFQFSPRLRRTSWHRRAGWLLVPAGITAALTGMWMVVRYPYEPEDWPLPAVVQLGVGTAWIIFLLLGYVAARRRDFARHSQWMIRGYALGQGTGTQALTLLPWMVIIGDPDEGLTGDVLFISAWMINLAVAEWVIRRRLPALPRTRAAARARHGQKPDRAGHTAPVHLDGRPDRRRGNARHRSIRQRSIRT